MKTIYNIVISILAVTVFAIAQTGGGFTPPANITSVLPGMTSVKLTGATGNGVTDDRAAIQKAMNISSTGRVYFPCGNYVIGSPLGISATKQLTLWGAGSGCTTITYTPSTGTAVTFNSPGGFFPDIGIRGITLIGPGRATSSVGISVAGTGSNNPAVWLMEDTRIFFFGTGLIYGENTYINKVDHSVIMNNGSAFTYAAGYINSGENNIFSHSVLADTQQYNHSCISINGPIQLTFEVTSLDNCHIDVASFAQITVRGGHLEIPGFTLDIPFISGAANNPNILLEGVNITLAAAPSATSLFTASTGNVGMTGLYIVNTSGTSLPALKLTGTASGYESGTTYMSGISTLIQNTGSGQASIGSGDNAFGGAQSVLADPIRLQSKDFSLRGYVNAVSDNANPQNLVKYSTDMTNGVWTDFCNHGTGTANTTDVTDPLGTNTAFKLTSVSSPAACGVALSGRLQVVTPSIPANQNYTTSIWARTLSGTASVNLGVDDPTVTVTATTTWQRFTVTQTFAVGSSRGFSFAVTNASNTVYFWAPQLVPGAGNSGGGMYVPTTATQYIPASVALSSVAQQGSFAKLGSLPGSLPALTSCGGSPAIDSDSSALMGTVTEGTVSTGCTITFATAFNTTPHCTVTARAGLGFSYTVSTAAIVVTNIGALSSTKLDYHCIGQ
jgi:hypothetical protein